MTIQERTIEYAIDGATYDAYMAWDDAAGDARPAVLVAHAWGGRSAFEEDKARWLAGLGYVGVAIDVYGKGVRGTSTEENAALMTPLVENRPLLQARLTAALAAAQAQDEVAADRCAAMGFCFGGLCVLDLARIGAAVAGVVSIHGLFGAPGNTVPSIAAKVLCLHGWDDPMATPDSVLELARELSGAGADWQVHAYGGTMHAFTNPAANDPGFGTVYSERADARAHKAIENFLSELFPG